MPNSLNVSYRGSPKHKNRPVRGIKGTLCPEWTHRAQDIELGTDMQGHPWQATQAAVLFSKAKIDSGNKRRYATTNGIAFEAKETGDGTWHGYPIPWEDVPQQVKDDWLSAKSVTRRQVKERFDKRDLYWALDTDKQ